MPQFHTALMGKVIREPAASEIQGAFEIATKKPCEVRPVDRWLCVINETEQCRRVVRFTSVGASLLAGCNCDRGADGIFCWHVAAALERRTVKAPRTRRVRRRGYSYRDAVEVCATILNERTQLFRRRYLHRQEEFLAAREQLYCAALRLGLTTERANEDVAVARALRRQQRTWVLIQPGQAKEEKSELRPLRREGLASALTLASL
jgi:hypothetical protein